MSRLGRRIVFCFAVQATALLGLGVVWHRSTAWHVATVGAVEATRKNLASIESVLSSLKDAETGERGYLITGDDLYLRPYLHSKSSLGRELRGLRSDLSSDGRRDEMLDELSSLIDAKWDSMEATIAARRTEGFQAAERIVRTHQGKDLMDRIRDLAREIGDVERGRLSIQSLFLLDRSRVLTTLAVAETGLSFVLLGLAYSLVAQDVARREHDLALEIASLGDLAMIDPLTGLRNRRYLDRSLSEAVADATRRGGELSLLLLDLDGFKSFNDAFGHPAGDDALRRMAALLLQAVPEPDAAARYGGEEFAVLLVGADAKAATARAEGLRAMIAAADWSYRPITASVGVATRDESTPDGAHLLTEADRALYSSKGRGRNRVTHYRDVQSPRGGATPEVREPAKALTAVISSPPRYGCRAP